MTDPATTVPIPVGGEGDPLLGSVRRALAADYDVEREIGRGGMAVVFKARDKELERPVALKVLPPELAPVATVADRFKREARLAASLEHPNIIPVYRVGQAGGVLYMAMKYIDGRSLEALVSERGALSLPVVLTVLRAAARAMAYAHAHGIVHRDIKGANILIDRLGRIVVSDFGIARAVESTSLTATGITIGTPHYMSPEQCAGKPVGPQSDQYSLGILAYQLLTGSVPFDGESVPEILQHHWFTPPPDASLMRPDSPAALTATVLRLLAKDPAQRFASTDDLVAALDRVPFSPAERVSGEHQLTALVRARRSAESAPVGAPAARPAAAEPTAAVTPTASDPGAPGIAGLVTGADVWAVITPADPPALGPPAAPPTPTRPMPIAAPPDAGPAEPPSGAMPTRPLTLGGEGGATGGRVARDHDAAPTDEEGSEQTTPARAARGQSRPARARGRPWRVAAIAAALAVIFVGGGFAVAAHREMAAGSTATVRRLGGPDMRRIGRQAYASGDYELARRFFIRALRIDPSDREAERDLGCVLLKLGRTDSARAHIQHAGGPAGCRAPDSH